MFHISSLVWKLERGSDFDNTVKTVRFGTGGVLRNRSLVISFNFIKISPRILINYFDVHFYSAKKFVKRACFKNSTLNF